MDHCFLFLGREPASFTTDGEIPMTDLLAQAFAQASKVPPEEQDAIADWLLKELESERRWDGAFAASQDALSQLATEAIAEHQQGKTKVSYAPTRPNN